MKLTRKQVKTILSYIDLIEQNIQSREEILLDIYSENDAYENIDDYSNPKYNDDIRSYLEYEYLGFKNEYLERIILNKFNVKIKILGKEEELNKCPCCNYRTLEARGVYDICKVCKWEDDGSNKIDAFSNVNRKTLREAQLEFEESKFISEKYIRG